MPYKINWYISESVKEAKKSTMLHRHGAIIIRKGEIIGRGFNYQYSNKKHGHYWSMHAEKDAIFDCYRKKADTTGAILIVIRLAPADNLSNSRPCIGCAEKIIQSKIKSIYYSIDNNTMTNISTKTINTEDMDKIFHRQCSDWTVS